MTEDKLPERIRQEIDWFRQLGGEVIVSAVSITLKPAQTTLAVATEYCERLQALDFGEQFDIVIEWK